jgi:exodeoxyribonuclease VII large subunit
MLGRMSSLPGSGQIPPAGIPDSPLPGPYPVGEYAGALRARLRAFANVQLIGEVVHLRAARARVYFELRDAHGAIPCAVWQRDWEAIVARIGEPPTDGAQVVLAGGCDYYPGSTTSSPGFSFSVSDLRIAGEGDLLARIERLRKQLDGEGLLERQKRFELPVLPRTIGVVTGESGKARDDLLAGLARRGWAGRIVWAFAPVQDRHAAPAITKALGTLAGSGEVEVAIVARGGGSLADLLCFCDETLCRTVALLSVPVIASVGHHTDRTLLDDVAAVSCSTPTHAAEAAVRLDCNRARDEHLAVALRLREHASRLDGARAVHLARAERLRDHGRRTVVGRARQLALLSRAPSEHIERQRTSLHQQLREIRAGARRRLAGERAANATRALVVARKASSTAHDCHERRPADLGRLALVLTGHDPQRTRERGYVLAQGPDGKPLGTVEAARGAERLRLRFADGELNARTTEEEQ